MSKEIWKDADEGGFFEGYYQVSNWGRWKILPRKVNTVLGERMHICKPRITEGSNSHGYRVVQMKKDGIRKMVGLHVLVAKAFIPNPENLPQINHLNAVRSDNRVENLEWSTQKQNVHHTFKLGRNKTTKGEQRANSKLKEADIVEMRNLYKTGKHSYRSLAEKYNVSFSHVDDIVNFKRWKHVH